jgi:O-Antigen ligase
MIRYLLVLLFFVMLMSRALGFDLSLGPGLSVKNALLYVTCGLMLIETAIARNRKIELLPVIVPFGLLFAYALASWLLIVLLLDIPTYSPRETLITLKTKLADQILMFLVFYYGVASLKDAIWLTKALIWIIILGNVVTVVDTWNIPDLGIITAREDGRVDGVLGSSNDFAAMVAFFLPATVAMYWTEQGVRRRLALFGVFVTVVALLMAASRGAMLGLVAGSLMALVYLRRFIPRQRIAAGLAAVIVVGMVAGIVLAVTDFGYLLVSRFTQGFGSDNFTVSSGRATIWSAALDTMLDSPWSFVTGFGWDAFYQSIGHKLAMHSDYMGYLYNLGLIGLTLLLSTYIGAIAAARKFMSDAPEEPRAYLMALVFGAAGFVIAMIFNDMQMPALYTWAFTGVALRMGTAGVVVAENRN